MEDETARQWAREAGATVLPFTQPPAVCATICALWIRRQLKNKTLFDAKRLYRPDGIDQRPLWEMKPDFSSKLHSLHKKIQTYGVGQIEPVYITSGRNEKILRDDKTKTKTSDVFKTIAEFPPKDIRKSGMGLVRTFESVEKKKCVGAIGYHFQSKSHAIALDCSKDNFKAVFFDPLIGQFSFQGFDPFLEWWIKCWEDREEGDNGNSWFFIRDDKQVTLQLYG